RGGRAWPGARGRRRRPALPGPSRPAGMAGAPDARGGRGAGPGRRLDGVARGEEPLGAGRGPRRGPRPPPPGIEPEEPRYRELARALDVVRALVSAHPSSVRRMVSGFQVTSRRSRWLALHSSAGPAARRPKTASSTTGVRVRTASMKFAVWASVSL